jgi:hypothetical protein
MGTEVRVSVKCAKSYLQRDARLRFEVAKNGPDGKWWIVDMAKAANDYVTVVAAGFLTEWDAQVACAILNLPLAQTNNGKAV